MAKLQKAVVLYFRPEDIGEPDGARCGKCMMFMKKGACTVVAGPIDGEHGICGLYVHGEHMGPDMNGMMPKSIAGYEPVGPTHCGNCKHYAGDASSGSCAIVEGKVEFHGCCNAWQEADTKEYKDWYMKERMK